MVTLVTNGIKVSVEVFYHTEYSRPDESKYIFAYRITLENIGYQTTQLLRRHWKIIDSTGDLKEVEGEGVIGVQPILKSGEIHQYVSWCQLTSDMGKMFGTYMFLNLADNETFDVNIPEFQLIATFKSN